MLRFQFADAMTGLDGLTFWRHPDFRTGFERYRHVAANRRPAKFLLARAIEVDTALDAPEDALWRELKAKTPGFLALWRGIGDEELPPPAQPSLLDLCRELTYRMLVHCNFCPWDGLSRSPCARNRGRRARGRRVTRGACVLGEVAGARMID